MWVSPDRRVWFFLIPIAILLVPFMALPPDHAFARYVETALYAACTVLGVGTGVLSMRDGVSLFRPNHTAAETPALFWLDVAGGCFLFGAIALWKTSATIVNAL
jgi:hypothetical protein